MKIAIVDDEPVWRERAAERIRAFYHFPVEIREYSGGMSFLESVTKMDARKEEPYDIVFLDVEMQGGLDGFETTIQFKNRHADTPVILLTAHGEYSRRGYRVRAFRYLEKQYLDEIDEALESIGLINPSDKWIRLPLAGNEVRQIRTIDVRFVEAASHGARVMLEKEVLHTAYTMQKLESLLAEEEHFYRCHQGYIVNWKYVSEIADLDAILDNGDKIPISRRRMREAQSRLVRYRYRRASR